MTEVTRKTVEQLEAECIAFEEAAVRLALKGWDVTDAQCREFAEKSVMRDLDREVREARKSAEGKSHLLGGQFEDKEARRNIAEGMIEGDKSVGLERTAEYLRQVFRTRVINDQDIFMVPE